MLEITTNDLIFALEYATSKVNVLGVASLEFDWNKVALTLTDKLRSLPDFTINIFCESDNLLFAKALTTDSKYVEKRYSFQHLKFRRDLALKSFKENHSKRLALSLDSTLSINHLNLCFVHLPLPCLLVEVDSHLYFSPWLHEMPQRWFSITPNDPFASCIRSYASFYFESKIAQQYSSNPGQELLELYDHHRIPRGIYPRNSFYDTDFSQLVVWAFVFDRQGRLLIHRRSDNAKDNQGMWDKSVGGHLDYSTDPDTSSAAVREVFEELFTQELEKNEFSIFEYKTDKMLYLGEWNPKYRGKLPFIEVARFPDMWTYFQLKGSHHIYSPRLLPDDSIRRLRVISDIYLFVASDLISDDNLSRLANSRYKLMEIDELKSVMDSATSNMPVSGFDHRYDVPRFTSDLTNIMTGELRDVLQEFSDYIKTYL